MEKRQLSLFDLISIAVGTIIGSGIMVLTGIGIGMTGRGIAWAFLVAGILVAIPVIAVASLGSAIPNKGGMYTYVRDLIGPKTGFFYIALMVAGQLVLANYALGFAEYALSLFPSINTKFLAMLMMTLIFLANITGLRTAVIIQKIMIIVLLSALLLFIIFGLPKVPDYGVFLDPAEVFPSGFTGFFAAVFLVRYALIGAEYLSEFGGSAKNPGRNIPLAMLSSIGVIAILYCLLGVVASGVLPVEDVAYQTLGSVAAVIFPKPLYLFFIIGGAMMALISTLNGVFSWCTQGINQAIEDGWLPKGLGVRNKKFGTPHILLFIFYVVGMFPIVLGREISFIAVLGNNIGLVFSILPILALYFLPRKNPVAYANAYFKLPKWGISLIVGLSLLIYGYGFYSGALFIGLNGVLVLVVYSILVILYTVWWEKVMIKRGNPIQKGDS